MATTAFELGRFDERRSDSHACSPITPSTVLETQCPAEELFQQHPSRPLLPSIYSQLPELSAGTDCARNSWHASHQKVYSQTEYEPLPRLDYEFGEALETTQGVEGSATTPHTLEYTTATGGGSAFSFDSKRAEGETLVPLSRHSRSLSGNLGHPLAPMTSDYLPSTSIQGLSSLAQGAADSSIASSSRLASHSTAKSRNSATGCYSHLPVLDTLVDAADFAQFDTASLSGKRNAPERESTRSEGEKTSNGGSGSIMPVRSKKQRSLKGRDRVRIGLAPDQPPTTQGKQRERVYVACQQCRSRKIRCDGAKPMCYNCNQRGTGICEFDSIPKRRGPDRQPGARQRHGKAPGPRTRRRFVPDNKEFTPPAQEVPYSADRRGSDPSTPSLNNQRPMWTSIPSPPSSTSTDGHGYACEHPAPVSAVSGASQVQYDYSSLNTAPFAYNTPQNSYAEHSLMTEPNQRLLSRISTESDIHPTAPLSDTFSPETCTPVSYSALNNPFGGGGMSPYANTPLGLATDEGRERLDSVTTLDSSVSPKSMSFDGYGSQGLDIAQPVVANQKPIADIASVDFGTLASQQRKNSDYLAAPTFRNVHSRRDSFTDVSPDSYNPYQWAVHQVQDTCAAYLSTSEDEDSAVPYEFSITQTPSLDFVRKTWWDSLLDTYCTEPYCTPAIAARHQSAYGLSVTIPRGTYSTGTGRQQVARIIVRDLQSLFKDCTFSFAFFNVPLFFGTFFRARETVQPALILGVLMFSNYLRSSAAELGSEGMMRTIWLRDKAHAALDASVSASWIDPGLAQAAWLLAQFELSSQPMRSVARLHSALATLDNIIRSLAITFIDAQDSSLPLPSDSVVAGFRSSITSNGHVSHILPMPLYNRQPIAGSRCKSRNSSQLLQYHSLGPRTAEALNHSLTSARSPSERPSCVCNELSLGYNWPEAKEHAPFWRNSPAWNPTWSDAEVRREECRRLCWNTLNLFAGYTTYRTSLGLATLDLFLLHPSNVHNIFPGENLTDLLPPSYPIAKLGTVWSLYARAILLWHACLRIRNVSDRERAVFAQSAWLEADAIEDALDGHTCNTERSFLYYGREYLFNARMYVSSEFRRFVPHPSPEMSGAVHRRKAEEWLTHQATVAKRSMQGLQALTGVRGSILARRPFFCFWFMGHVSRCLQLWQVDKTLTVALELAKHFLSPINYLSALWPCDDQRMQYTGIRRQLEDACREAGVALPPPMDPSFPLPSSLTGLF